MHRLLWFLWQWALDTIPSSVLCLCDLFDSVLGYLFAFKAGDPMLLLEEKDCSPSYSFIKMILIFIPLIYNNFSYLHREGMFWGDSRMAYTATYLTVAGSNPAPLGSTGQLFVCGGCKMDRWPFQSCSMRIGIDSLCAPSKWDCPSPLALLFFIFLSSLRYQERSWWKCIHSVPPCLESLLRPVFLLGSQGIIAQRPAVLDGVCSAFCPHCNRLVECCACF